MGPFHAESLLSARLPHVRELLHPEGLAQEQQFGRVVLPDLAGLQSMTTVLKRTETPRELP
ncbi:MAG: hypothetical protein AAF355_11155 [Myxococcota bacterium]